jgi:hypothetical protein
MTDPRRAAANPIWDLISRIENASGLSAGGVCEIVRNAGLKAADLHPWAKFGHDPRDSYGRGVVYDQNGIEVMVATWEPSDFSAIHNHGHLEWGAVQVFGRVEHAIFEYDGDQFTTSTREFVDSGTVLGVNNALYHQMGSADSESFLTLHVYGADLESGSVTHDAEIIDLFHRQVFLSNGGVFYHFDRINERYTRGTPPTSVAEELRDCVHLCNRMLTRHNGSEASTLDLGNLVRNLYCSPRFARTCCVLDALVGHSELSRPIEEFMLALSAMANNQESLVERGVLPRFSPPTVDRAGDGFVVALGNDIFRAWTNASYMELASRFKRASEIQIRPLDLTLADPLSSCGGVRCWSCTVA